ncbi:transposon Tf2-9 polyprotein [Trichonephila clavipes]|uniref:RNA-directed DNA polymerase n=1 Tax=Trichonephila clavipes TaxID=2585209 RepID=A0A8X6SD94_TRICX|nr:transposon Tf2-9 polyprotein [Trichonephila clavipes]
MTNRLKWIAFEKDHIRKPLEFWRNVIFSDEGKFYIFGIKGCKLVWRKPCTALQKGHLVPTVKHGGGGVMVWGCMASNDVGKQSPQNVLAVHRSIAIDLMLTPALEDRVEAIFKFPQPTAITRLRRFLAMLNYYRRFIRQAAHILAPLVNFLKGIRNKKRPKRKVKIKPEEVLEWTDEATTAFELVKQALAHATLLHHTTPNAPLSIWADASDFAVGGALAQYHENAWQPLAFLFMKFSVSQKNWSTYDRKFLAIYTMVKRFRHML